MLVEEIESSDNRSSHDADAKHKLSHSNEENSDINEVVEWFYFERMYQFPFAPSGLFSKLIVRLLSFTRFNTKVWDLRFSKNSIFLKKNNAHANRYRASTMNNLLTGTYMVVMEM
jgi:hypothetical protein